MASVPPVNPGPGADGSTCSLAGAYMPPLVSPLDPSLWPAPGTAPINATFLGFSAISYTVRAQRVLGGPPTLACTHTAAAATSPAQWEFLGLSYTGTPLSALSAAGAALCSTPYADVVARSPGVSPAILQLYCFNAAFIYVRARACVWWVGGCEPAL